MPPVLPVLPVEPVTPVFPVLPVEPVAIFASSSHQLMHSKICIYRLARTLHRQICNL